MISTLEIKTYLEGLNFPADRAMIVRYAKQKGAGNGTVNALKNISDRDYDDIMEVMDEVKIAEDMDIDEE